MASKKGVYIPVSLPKGPSNGCLRLLMLYVISLLLGLAIVLFGLAMRRGVHGRRIAYFGFVTGAFAVVGGYPYAIGPLMPLVCEAVVAVWFVVAGATLYRLGQSGPAGMVRAAA